jgi:hypothetical protein
MGSLNAENQYMVGVTQDQEENTTSWDSSLNSNLHYTNLALAAEEITTAIPTTPQR